MYNIEEIMDKLPHRYPFLLVDRILEYEPEKRVVGIKNVTINEPFFSGHFPNQPVMPGVLLIEAIAQVGAFGLFSDEKFKGKKVYLVGVDNARFRRQIIPGDVLYITVEFINFKQNLGKVKGEVRVNEMLACEAELFYAVR